MQPFVKKCTSYLLKYGYQGTFPRVCNACIENEIVSEISIKCKDNVRFPIERITWIVDMSIGYQLPFKKKSSTIRSLISSPFDRPTDQAC